MRGRISVTIKARLQEGRLGRICFLKLSVSAKIGVMPRASLDAAALCMSDLTQIFGVYPGRGNPARSVMQRFCLEKNQYSL